MYESTNDGRGWQEVESTFRPDRHGNVPALHMSEGGITLRSEPHAGRLIRPARVYGDPGYNTAVFSDDGGDTWHASEPFPVAGTGEGAIVELHAGELYYSSRTHWFGEDEPFRHERRSAWSDDGGRSWHHAAFEDTLPDGPRYCGRERRGNNYNSHFGMMAGLTRLPIPGRDVLLYSIADPVDHERRRRTVWGSFEGGETGPHKRLGYDDFSAYSTIANRCPGTASPGRVFLVFEYGK